MQTCRFKDKGTHSHDRMETSFIHHAFFSLADIYKSNMHKESLISLYSPDWKYGPTTSQKLFRLCSSCIEKKKRE